MHRVRRLLSAANLCGGLPDRLRYLSAGLKFGHQVQADARHPLTRHFGFFQFQRHGIILAEGIAEASTEQVEAAILAAHRAFAGWSRTTPAQRATALLAIADYITKVHAICVQCGDIAHFSYRKSADKNKVLLGEKDSYEPRCRACYHKGME